jgi:gluconolactonase
MKRPTLYRELKWAAMCACVLAAAPVQAQRPSGSAAIVSPNAALERIFADGINTEGPAVAPDGTLFFVDAPVSTTTPRTADRIWRLDPRTQQASIFRSPSGMALGIEFDARGRMLVTEMSYSGGRRLIRTDPRTGESEIVAALYNGRPLGGLADLTIDERGRTYVTEHDAIAPHEVLYHRTPGVYRIDSDGAITRVIDNAGLPNGIAISPDQRTLYVTTWRLDMFGARALLAYDILPDDRVAFREVLVRYTAPQGPDGIAMDLAGNIWVAIHATSGPTGVAVYDAAGNELAFIPTPEPAKNVAFGRDADRNLLYITAGRSVYRIRVEKAGYHLPAAAR